MSSENIPMGQRNDSVWIDSDDVVDSSDLDSVTSHDSADDEIIDSEDIIWTT